MENIIYVPLVRCEEGIWRGWKDSHGLKTCMTKEEAKNKIATLMRISEEPLTREDFTIIEIYQNPLP